MSAETGKSLGPMSATEFGVGPTSKNPQSEAPSVVERGVGERVTPEPPPPGAEAAPAAPAERGPSGVTVDEDIDFAALMSGSAPVDRDRAFEPGDHVSGVVEVVSLHGPEIFLDLGGKATGYVLKDEFSDAEGNVLVSPGDRIEGIVAGTTASGVHVRVKLGGDADSHALREAFEAGVPVQGKVLSTNKGGYEVLVAGQRAFCPFSQIDVYRLDDPESVVGQAFDFKITEMRPGSVVISRAALLRAEQAERAAETLTKIVAGARMKGRVRSIQSFGVFVDLGGVDGLVHISELSWGRTEDPNTVVSVGDHVEVMVLEVKQDKGRIALSLKQAQGDPYETSVSGLAIGDNVTGTVVRLANFGAFVEIAPGVDGLLHVSDLAHHRIRHPKDLLEVGDGITVRITEIDLARRRVGLSLKALMADPWDGIAERFPAGQTIEGTVESVQDFGVFITVEAGVTALLPASESNTPRDQPLSVSFKPGDSVQAKVLRVDVTDRKMALTRRDDADRPRRDSGGAGRGRGGDRRGPRDGARPPRGAKRGTVAYRDAEQDVKDVGSFGAALLAAMKKDGED